MIHKEPKEYPPTDLRNKGEGRVQFAVSYYYNGGIIIDDDWYPGVHVPGPILNPGWKLRSIGVGSQLNALPPLSTMFLERVLR